MMKAYLIQFRDQVFNGALSLYKRIFFSYLILNIMVSIITILIIVPLWLKFMGWSFSDLSNLEATMAEMSKEVQDGADPKIVFSELLSKINFVYLIPVFLVGMIIFPWSYNLYFTLNDLEIREKNKSVMAAFKKSFSGKIFSLLGYMIVYYLLMISATLIFIFIIAMIMSAVKFLGIILGFIGFFFLIFFLIRFVLGPAAIVHGNMSVSQAFSFSYTNLTFKRSALIFLMFLVLLVVMAIVGAFASLIVNMILQKEGSDPMVYFWINQLISSILGAVIGAFMFAAVSALYFRYSADELEGEDSDHLIIE